MSNEWLHQIRFGLTDEAAAKVHDRPDDPSLTPLQEILARHKTSILSQYDAFANYCAEAEREGVRNFPLYKWTKAVIDDPAKKTKYLKIFTCYIEDAEVYAKDKADALEADLRPLVGGGLLDKLDHHDTNPANNPQPPAHLRG